VVRIWREQGLPWRGWVQHAGTREQVYIQSVGELVAFLSDHTAGLLEHGRNEGEEYGQ
jgi:hypothetical protein